MRLTGSDWQRGLRIWGLTQKGRAPVLWDFPADSYPGQQDRHKSAFHLSLGLWTLKEQKPSTLIKVKWMFP